MFDSLTLKYAAHHFQRQARFVARRVRLPAAEWPHPRHQRFDTSTSSTLLEEIVSQPLRMCANGHLGRPVEQTQFKADIAGTSFGTIPFGTFKGHA